MKVKLLFTFVLLLTAVTGAWADDYSGSCGENVTYSYVESTNTLTISGSGAMKDYEDLFVQPWNSYANDIETVVIGDGVTSIGSSAFWGSGLTTITIPASVTSIGDHAFYSCSDLKTITIPASVTSIGEGAFDGCSNLATVTVYAPSCTLGYDAFDGCNKLTNIYVFSDLVDDYKGAENWSDYASKITAMPTVTISYVDAGGTLQEDVEAVPLNNAMMWLPAGTYVVKSDVNYPGKITLGGEVNIILGDGKTMTVTNTGTGSDDHAIFGDSGALNIYGQSQGTGALTATATACVGIKVDDNITINGGIVTATSNSDAGVYGIDGVTINDGTVNATGIYADGNVTINGGKVTNTSDPGIRSNNGTITLGLRNATDNITAESYNAGSICVKDGQTLTDGTNTYSGTLYDSNNTSNGKFATLDELNSAIAEKTLYLYTEHLDLAASLVDGNYWTTFYCGHTGYKIDDSENDAWAYTAEYDKENAQLTLHKLGKVIPKETAVILVGDDNSISMTASGEAAQYTVGNDLKGLSKRTLADDVKTTYGASTLYVMGKTASGFGFHKYTGAYMPANKAFLALSSTASAPLRMVFSDDEGTTGIAPMSDGRAEMSDVWYTLDGRQLNGKPTSKGLYIVNGKKVVVR